MRNRIKSEPMSWTRPRRAGAFTIIELLMVMFVITMLLTIGVPVIINIRKQAKINACQVTVNIIDKAVSMYHDQHNRYPTMKAMPAELYGQSFKNGVEVIEGDWRPGPGYRLEPRGAIYGPWNGVDQLRRSGDYEGSSRVFFLDAFNQSIWYCVFNQEAATGAKAYIDADFNVRGDAAEPGTTLIDVDDYAKNENGRYYRRDYILMSQSADGKWGKLRGPPNNTQNVKPTDDVTNFFTE